jgi:predicted O-methyltransferase YrrM
MTEPIWGSVDEYFAQHLGLSDPVLEAALAASLAAGLPAIAVTPPQGKLLHLFAQLIGARRILEIGTLGGYSTIWLARGILEGGKVVTLEIDAHHAEVARANIANAGLSDRVEVIVGPAAETLGAFTDRKEAPFDLTFIDADKSSSDVYFRIALGLSHPGSLIIVDNVVRDGAVASDSNDANILGIQQMLKTIAGEPRVSATAIQTVGSKGYDGFVLARVVR